VLRPASATPKGGLLSHWESESFQSILAIGAGGIVIDTTGNPIFQPGQRTSGLGIWKHSGRDTDELLSNAFLLDSLTEPLPPPFQPGTQQIVQHITLENDQEFTSNATIQYFDTTGAKGISGCATAVGTRLKQSGQIF
jgi:hypothetical protein